MSKYSRCIAKLISAAISRLIHSASWVKIENYRYTKYHIHVGNVADAIKYRTSIMFIVSGLFYKDFEKHMVLLLIF